jgi:PAS domain S-box-containing protein
MFLNIIGAKSLDDFDASGAASPNPGDDARLLFDAIPGGLLILLPDDKLTIAAANDAYIRQVQMSRDSLIGRSFFDAFPLSVDHGGCSNLSSLQVSLREVVASKQAQRLDIGGYAASDTESDSAGRLWRIENAPVWASDGSLLCVVHQVEDITDVLTCHQKTEALERRSQALERHLANTETDVLRQRVALTKAAKSLQRLTQESEAWRLGEENFRLITDTLPQSVWTARPDGYLDYHNKQFSEFAGAPPEAAMDGLWVRFIHPEDVQGAQSAWSASVASGEPYETTFRVRHRSGEYRWTLARAVPLRDEAQQIVKWVGTNTDIHEKVIGEQELRDAHRRKDEFLAMLAHELRNPLVPIGAGAEMLAMAKSDDKHVREVSDMIRRQVKHVTGLINDLLDVSRVTRGLIALDMSIVDMKQVLHDSAEQSRPLFEAHRHRLNLHLPAEPVCVSGDFNRLVQVFSNLLNNAAKYTPEGGEATLTIEATSTEVSIRVKDNGVGMDADLLSRAFDLFQQGERTVARIEGGLGLGLALVRSLVEQHGGVVTAASDGLGKGSEFTVRLPLAVGQPVTNKIKDVGDLPVPSEKGRRILLVDDNVDVAESVGMVLEILGHQVAVEHEAASAIRRAQSESFDSCILDIGLPDMSGYELSRALHAQSGTKDAVFTAHTGYGQLEDRELSAKAGFAHHLVKPAGIAEIERVLVSEHANRI